MAHLGFNISIDRLVGFGQLFQVDAVVHEIIVRKCRLDLFRNGVSLLRIRNSGLHGFLLEAEEVVLHHDEIFESLTTHAVLAHFIVDVLGMTVAEMKEVGDTFLFFVYKIQYYHEK